jgi:polysaccharide pyruvyl transferase
MGFPMTIAILARNAGRIPESFCLTTNDLMRNCGNNLGNLAFWYCTSKLIDETMCFIGWSARAKDLPSDTKALVIPAANFLNEYSDLSPLTRLVREVDLHCVLIGIGAQSETFDQLPVLPECTIQFMQEVSKRTSWIGVRGEYSQRVCESIGITNSIPLDCPSILICPAKTMGVTIENRLRRYDEGPLAIHASAIKAPLRTVETELVRYTKLYQGSKLIIQRPPEFIKLMIGDPLSAEDRICIEESIEFLSFCGTTEDFRYYLREVGFVPVDVESWVFNLRHLSGAIGTRIHGTIISLQALIPSVCVWHDTRTAELCEQLCIPSIDILTFCENKGNLQRLMRKVKFDGERFDVLRIAAANRYRDIFESAGVKPSGHLLSFGSAQCAPMPIKETIMLKSRSPSPA